RVTDGLDHGEYAISCKAIGKELPSRLLEPNKAERGFSGVNFELPEESIGSIRRAKKGLESDLGLLEIGRQFDASSAQAAEGRGGNGGPPGNIAAEGQRRWYGLLNGFRQRFRLALDGSGERIPLPFGFRDGADEATGAGHQRDVERADGCHTASSPPARENGRQKAA